MSCYNCTQAAIEKDAKRISIKTQAKDLANRTQEWVVIYTDEKGERQIALASSGNYPYPEYVTPDM